MELDFLVNSFIFGICFWKMAFRVSLFVVIDLVKLGCVVSEVCCSILEIDLVKQAFLVRFFVFSYCPFVEIDFGRIVSFTKTNVSGENYFL